MQTVDAKGLACPQPVVLTRRAMAKGEPVLTIVDNDVALANVSRMGRSAGWEVQAETGEGCYYITLTPPTSLAVAETAPVQAQPAALDGPLVVLLASDVIGQGDDRLGAVLMRAFLHTLQEVKPKPDVIICMNGGVRLAVEGSQVFEDLRALTEGGIELLLCGTCLDFFGLKDKVSVGTISNMYSIAETLLSAGKVVRL